MTKPLLSARSVSFCYGSHEVLRQVGLDVHPGDFLAVVGPNGSGKSTLLRLLSGFLRPGVGQVHCDGEDVRKLPPSRRGALLGYLPQSVVTDFAFTVSDILGMGTTSSESGLFESTSGQQRVANILAELDLMHLARRPFPELSGGEQKLALIGKTWVQDPQVFLLDEPVAALDLRRVGTVMQGLKRRTLEGRAVVCVLHDLNLALRFSSRILLLSRGACAYLGDIQGLMQPGLLEDVYGVPFHRTTLPHDGRPILVAEPTSL